MSKRRFHCSDSARERDDPLIGTAPVTSAFLLIEHPGPWRFDALSGAGWSPPIVAALTAAVQATRGRLLLIRRPGTRTSGTERVWGLTAVGGGTHWRTWRDEADLLDAATALRSVTETAQTSTEARTSSDPVLLVCAHGVHDTCCAVRGRPVAAELARQWPTATWECSHVGGDRFAPNVVVLPDGTYYGGLDTPSAPAVIEAHLGGRVDVRHLRGSVRWPPAAQAAVAEIHRRLGPYAADEVAADRWTAAGSRRWSVEVSVAGGRRFTVDVVAERRDAAALTCAASQATVAAAYRIEAVRSS